MGFSEVGHSGFSEDSLWILWGGHSGILRGFSEDCVGLSTATIPRFFFWDSLGFGHSRDSRGLGAGARQRFSGVRHSGDSQRILWRLVPGDQAETRRGVVAEFNF